MLCSSSCCALGKRLREGDEARYTISPAKVLAEDLQSSHQIQPQLAQVGPLYQKLTNSPPLSLLDWLRNSSGQHVLAGVEAGI
jgi:hypothetical protein